MMMMMRRPTTVYAKLDKCGALYDVCVILLNRTPHLYAGHPHSPCRLHSRIDIGTKRPDLVEVCPPYSIYEYADIFSAKMRYNPSKYIYTQFRSMPMWCDVRIELLVANGAATAIKLHEYNIVKQSFLHHQRRQTMMRRRWRQCLETFAATFELYFRIGVFEL